VKIATYNVNGVNGRLPVLLRWLELRQPDIVALQELKAPDEKFPEKAIRDLGYDVVWHGQKSWNGVALLSRCGEIHETRRGLAGDPEDVQSRYIEAAAFGVVVGCLYAPNGNPQPGPKFEAKMRWLARLQRHAQGLIGCGAPAVLAGDYNIIPTELDVYVPERWTEDALFHPRVRQAYAELMGQGWIDALRERHPGERVYTFWKYLRNAYQRDAGLRIDHILLSSSLRGRFVDVGVEREHRGREKPSDHAAVWVELAEG